MGIEAQVVLDLAAPIVAQLAASATGRSRRPGAGAAEGSWCGRQAVLLAQVQAQGIPAGLPEPQTLEDRARNDQPGEGTGFGRPHSEHQKRYG